MIKSRIKTKPVRTLFLFSLLILCLGTFSCDQGKPINKPNIVLILVENISTEIACYGDPHVKTPNIDHLAREGIRYAKAFTTSSVCAPSRAAMMTGAYQIRSNTQHLRMNRDRALPAPFRSFTHYLRQAGYFTALGCGYSYKTDINFSPQEGEFYGFDGNDWGERSNGQPFFAQLTLDNTHRGDHWYEEDPAIKPESITLPPEMPDHPVCRDDYARYLTQIQKMDEHTGEILERLEKEGILDKTLIIWMSDNGRDLVRGMDWLYDPGILVPMIIRWPGMHQAGVVHEELVCSLDAIATILYAAGVEIPEHMDGYPLFGPDKKNREYIFAARDRVDEAVDRIRCVRSDRYKYIRNYMPERGYYEKRWAMENNPPLTVVQELHKEGRLSPEQETHMAEVKPEEELYDLVNDPNEFHNLADDSEHAETLKHMRKLLEQWVEETGDMGQFHEKREDALETQWFSYDEVYGAE